MRIDLDLYSRSFGIKFLLNKEMIAKPKAETKTPTIKPKISIDKETFVMSKPTK